jgi:cytochrome c peroxidase
MAGMQLMRQLVTVLIAFACLLGAAASKQVIQLNHSCPPYFEKTAKATCKLQSLYQIYPAVNDQWGGYRVALPQARDGFTPEQIDLGRLLFFDPILSYDQDMSCAHCHHPQLGLADGRGRSIGRHGHGIGKQRRGGVEMHRAAPPLWNLALLENFFWDGRAESLEKQLEDVMSSPNEMTNTPENVVASLSAIATYKRLFHEAFNAKEIRYDDIKTAMVAFETSLVSLNSRYDRYIHGAQNALSEKELNGLNIFRSFATRCSQCHSPPLFTNNQLAIIGLPTPANTVFDAGAQTVSGEPSLRGAFRVPSLRNIARTAPYMHAGQFSTLAEVIEFYNDKPGHAVPDDEKLMLNWHMVDPGLTDAEASDLVAFLHTLTDETALPEIPETVPSGLPVVLTDIRQQTLTDN